MPVMHRLHLDAEQLGDLGGADERLWAGGGRGVVMGGQ
jgi:hypothetical protein